MPCYSLRHKPKTKKAEYYYQPWIPVNQCPVEGQRSSGGVGLELDPSTTNGHPILRFPPSYDETINRRQSNCQTWGHQQRAIHEAGSSTLKKEDHKKNNGSKPARKVYFHHSLGPPPKSKSGSCISGENSHNERRLFPKFHFPPYSRSTSSVANMHPEEETPRNNKSSSKTSNSHVVAKVKPEETLVTLDTDDTPAKPRSPYLTASDYVFYIRRQLARERGFEGDPPEDKNMMVELPKLTDLLRRLRDDLRCSFTSFVEDFVGEPNEGVNWLLDLLKACQTRKSRSDGNMSVRQKEKHQMMKRMLADEFECLLCLRFSTRSLKAIEKISSHRNGLSTVATCIMSDFTKSRMLALQLLTKICELSPNGFNKVLEAMSSLRLIYGESVRFKFLVAILNGNASTPQGFEYVALGFLNTLLTRCPRPAERVRLQCELEEAGFHVALLEAKLRDKETSKDDQVWAEIQYWKDRYLDVNNLLDDRRKCITENSHLKDEIEVIRKTMKKLEMDKINLMQIERDLKEKCVDLEHEIGKGNKTSNTLPRVISANPKKPEVSKKISASEDSDSSDPHAPDSGRCSFMTDEGSPAEETDQPDSEEIFIDIPTICPPVGFRANTSNNIRRENSESILSKVEPPSYIDTLNNVSLEKPKLTRSAHTSVMDLQSMSMDSHPTQKRERENIVEREGIEWEYPIIPKITTTPAMILKRSRSEDKSRSGKKSLRTRSEERHQAQNRQSDQVKYVEATGFFYKTRNRKPLSELFPETFEKVKPSNVEPVLKSITNVNSSPSLSKSQKPTSVSSSNKHFPLPNAYRSNFILKGHGNCDMYSSATGTGGKNTNLNVNRDSMRKLEPLDLKDLHKLNNELPKLDPFIKNGNGRKSEMLSRSHAYKSASTNNVNRLESNLTNHGTISALVHKEIAEAVRQISGWL